ncbi:alpha-galactosidase [Francisella sp. 19X1-34]|uniref:alpha-galactosidase n=1 Tax=Francisella sp. 19X1-34 TaxID=3087177 RepID=UPI002E35B937|nr:alpha-galactosidase [Francisella sp. 19X1-34]MED7787684.1 alpha-galactosidase [Francisella sp. 19X1-34]
MKFINLKGKNSCFIIILSDKDLPRCIYWDKLIDLSQNEIKQLDNQKTAIPQAMLDEPSLGSLLPTIAEGDFSLNAIELTSNTSWSPKFKVTNIQQEKSSVLFTLKDQGAMLEAKISLNLDSNDILYKNIKLINLSNEKIIVNKLLNTLIIPSQDIEEMTQYHGRWIQEGQESTSQWNQPSYIAENIKGRTSNDNPSMLRLQQIGTNNNQGKCYAFSLAWSGNHTYILKRLDNNDKSIQWGEKLISDEITLEENQSYTTPTLLATFSANGFNGLRHNWHNYIRHSNILAKHTRSQRPIQINTWEAVYFDHNIETFKKMINRSAEIGIERFVLDDGWFNGRNGEKAGLGDWFVDKQKYPQGLHPLVDYTISKDLEFGLWFEPEMVNSNSELYRNHPEWILKLSNYEQKLGRYQYVLDLSNLEAYEYILKCMSDILNEYKISYVKWDMNRDLIQPGNIDNKPSYHNQVIATYKLLDELKTRFPSVEFESCSSGGARIDMKVLEYTNRFWSSDCNDPLERQKIHRSLSQFYPPEVLGAHVGPNIAHTTSRANNIEYSLITSFAGHLGFERNLLELDEVELQVVKKYIKLYKDYRDLIHSSDHYYFDTDTSQIAQCFLSKDKSKGLVTLFQNTISKNTIPRALKFSGLDKTKTYKLRALNKLSNTGYAMKQTPNICNDEVVLSGKALESFGLNIPIMHPQSAILISIDEIQE